MRFGPNLTLWNEFTNALGPALYETSSGSAPPGKELSFS